MKPDFTTGYTWEHDPKHLAFSLARYHFVARMLTGFERVIEVGAGDGVQSRVVAKAVKELLVTDKDNPNLLRWNPINGPIADIKASAVYALDVLEHVDPSEEDAFMRGICATLYTHGTCIIGMPSLESQIYASEGSRADHVNTKTEEGLRETMKRHFHCVYLFGMNDCVLHVGYGPMSHYRFALCNSPIR